MTNKKFIIQYILLKIVAGDYPVGAKLPSEHSIAVKFNCSRITARTAYSHLESIGLIVAQKGVGYYVEKSSDEFLWTLGKSTSDSKTKLSRVTNIEILNELEVNNNNFETYKIEYFDNSDKLTTISYWTTTKISEYFETKPNNELKTLFKPIVETGKIIQKINERLSFKRLSVFDEVSKLLNYSDYKYPVSETLILGDDNEMIVKIIAVASSDTFEVKRQIWMSIFD